MFGVKRIRILVETFPFYQFRGSTSSFVKPFGPTNVTPVSGTVSLILVKKKSIVSTFIVREEEEKRRKEKKRI